MEEKYQLLTGVDQRDFPKEGGGGGGLTAHDPLYRGALYLEALD